MNEETDKEEQEEEMSGWKIAYYALGVAAFVTVISLLLGTVFHRKRDR